MKKKRNLKEELRVLFVLIIVAFTVKTSVCEIYIVPTGQSKGMQHAIEVDTTLAGKAVIERTGIVMGVGDFIVVNSQNGTTSFNVWGVDLA